MPLPSFEELTGAPQKEPETTSTLPSFEELTSAEEPGILRQLGYGFDSTRSDVENFGMVMESYFPLGNIDFSNMEYISPEEMYPPEFFKMDQEQRLQFLNKRHEDAVNTEYADVINAGLQDSGWSTAGSFGGALTSPTTLTPVGQSYKSAALLSGLLGIEYDVLNQYTRTGEVDPKQTALVGGGAAVLGPSALWVGRQVTNKLSTLNAKRSVAKAENISAADSQIQRVNEAVAEAQAYNIPKEQMSDYVQRRTGLTNNDILEASTISSIKPTTFSAPEARLANDIPSEGVDAVTRVRKPSIDKIFGSISTRIGNISPALKNRLRKLDMDSHANTHQRLTETAGFKNIYKQLENTDRRTLKGMLLNGDYKAASELIARANPEGTVELNKVVTLLSNMHKELQKAGYNDIGFVENYFPRVVKDVEGLMASLGKEKKSYINSALEKRAEQLKVSVSNLPQVEREKIINNILRGYSPKITNTGMSFVKGRTLDRLDDRLLDFYADPLESLHSYIRSTTHNIERRKFFGQYGKNMGETIDTEASVGSLVDSLGDDLTDAQLTNLKDMLNARFVKGEQGAHATVQAFRNIGYGTTLGNPYSALTQIGDLGLSAYAHGLRNTFASILGKRNITMQELGLDDILAEEFANEKVMAKALHHVFTISGFRHIDRLGKNVNLNAAYRKATSLSKSEKGIAKLREKYGGAFGSEFNGLVDDLRAGNMTENVKLYLWNELADVQPISLSEMPQKYLESPNGRILYSLKTFTLKQMDMLRRDIGQQWKKGNKKEAVRNLVAYSLLVPGANVTVDMAKDFLRGREVSATDLDDRIVANIFKTFGASDYIMEKHFGKGKIATGIEQMVLPPIQWIDSVGTDLMNLVEGRPSTETVKELPLIGQFWHNFFGGGLEEWNEKQFQKRLETGIEPVRF